MRFIYFSGKTKYNQYEFCPGGGTPQNPAVGGIAGQAGRFTPHQFYYLPRQFAEMAELADLPAGRQAHTTQNLLMYFVYVINSLKRKYLYVGLTNNFERRFEQHRKGKVKTTAPYRPFELVLKEMYQTRPLAREREKYLKSGSGKEWLKKQAFKDARVAE